MPACKWGPFIIHEEKLDFLTYMWYQGKQSNLDKGHRWDLTVKL